MFGKRYFIDDNSGDGPKIATELKADRHKLDILIWMIATLSQKVDNLMSQNDDLKAAIDAEDAALKQLLAYTATSVASNADLQAKLAEAIAATAPDLSPMIAELQAHTAEILSALPTPAPIPPAPSA